MFSASSRITSNVAAWNTAFCACVATSATPTLAKSQRQLLWLRAGTHYLQRLEVADTPPPDTIAFIGRRHFDDAYLLE
jgi:hypothetical protein